MEHSSHNLATAFVGHRLLATGSLPEVALAVKAAGDTVDSILVFKDATGALVDLDLRGSEQDILRRLEPAPSAPPFGADEAATVEPRGRGRPRLGVVAREVTLLPRHWEWLNAQRGGASVALRKLVEEARRALPDQERKRQSQEAAYRAMSALAGDLPNFEEASRALFADDAARLADLAQAWPDDIRRYVLRLAGQQDEHSFA
ncbi:DUF2239 family protein [Aquabacterium sp. CECT 9606]|uniref:DUF2239 family protein n=1 Tax=Aquabacterium sp. CECT 9606 TaxID=2845822 RepID=UPI001E38FB68|nr:DUF2239 family protein [Aquabacterium sp. CECT 9606]CAH0355664.1 hypothetical protein AQB9606_04328 [Aquabacterium sp. CECT 9606]